MVTGTYETQLDKPPTSPATKPTESLNVGTVDQPSSLFNYMMPTKPGDVTPKAGDTTPKTGDTTPKTGDTTPKTGDTTPKTGDTTPKTGDTTPKTGDTTPKTGDATPKTGDTTPTDKPSNVTGDKDGNGSEGDPYNSSDYDPKSAHNSEGWYQTGSGTKWHVGHDGTIDDYKNGNQELWKDTNGDWWYGPKGNSKSDIPISPPQFDPSTGKVTYGWTPGVEAFVNNTHFTQVLQQYGIYSSYELGGNHIPPDANQGPFDWNPLDGPLFPFYSFVDQSRRGRRDHGGGIPT